MPNRAKIPQICCGRCWPTVVCCCLFVFIWGFVHLFFATSVGIFLFCVVLCLGHCMHMCETLGRAWVNFTNLLQRLLLFICLCRVWPQPVLRELGHAIRSSGPLPQVSSPITSNSRTSILSKELPSLKISMSIIALFQRFGVISIITKYISTGQKLLSQIQKVLKMKKRKKRKITRTLANPEVIQPKLKTYYSLWRHPLPLHYRNFLADQEPLPNKQVCFLESLEAHHQSQVRFLHHLYPKENNPHLHLVVLTPWYLGWGAAIARFGCSFIELTGAGVSDVCISCAPNVVMLFWGAKMPRMVGATVR